MHALTWGKAKTATSAKDAGRKTRKQMYVTLACVMNKDTMLCQVQENVTDIILKSSLG